MTQDSSESRDKIIDKRKQPVEAADESSMKFLEPIVLQSKLLFQGRREIWIEHEDQMYRLRATTKGRLYLTK